MSAIVVSDNLFQEVKNYLDITWDDTDADEKLTGQIQRGIAYISSKTGVDASAFEPDAEDPDDRAKELLLNYVLYDRSGALNDFKRNYQSDIVGLRIRWEVANATESEG
jgi:hypothetical protein